MAGALRYSLAILVILHAPRLSYQKRLRNKGHLNSATEVLKDFSPGVFNRFYITHSKSSNSGNLEPKSELKIFPFHKVILKATVVNSDS